MNEDELTLKQLIKDCKKSFCPLYSNLFNISNAQGHIRKGQYGWTKKCFPKQFSVNEKNYGAKLALIMESPPPKFMEYFYGPEWGFEKEKGLFPNLIRKLIEIEGFPAGAVNEKPFYQAWFANLGLVILDAVKCRAKITPANYNSVELKTEKISPSQFKDSVMNCSDILKLQLQTIKPFRTAVVIAGVYDYGKGGECYVKSILSEIGNDISFIDSRTVSLWDYKRPQSFLNWFEGIYIKVNEELRAG